MFELQLFSETICHTAAEHVGAVFPTVALQIWERCGGREHIHFVTDQQQLSAKCRGGPLYNTIVCLPACCHGNTLALTVGNRMLQPDLTNASAELVGKEAPHYTELCTVNRRGFLFFFTQHNVPTCSHREEVLSQN